MKTNKVIFFLLCTSFCSCVNFDNNRSKRYESNTSFEKLKLIATGISASAPIMINEELSFDFVLAVLPMTLMYQYTYVNYENETIDIDQQMVEEAKKKSINYIKSSIDNNFYKENKVSFCFDYKNKNGVFLYRINIESDEVWTN